MAETKFLANLQNYAKDTINAEMIDLLVPYFEFPTYTFECAKTACGNVAGLISWTLAMASFYEVNRDVLPLKANLARQQARLEKAETKLNNAMELLRTKEEEVRQCQEEYDEAMRLKQVWMTNGFMQSILTFHNFRLCSTTLTDAKTKWTKPVLSLMV